MGILLNDSPINQLTECIEFEHYQAILELATKPLPEASLLLLICVHVVPSILRECVESLGILHQTAITLFQG